MKNSETPEAWFVTGSQHLYGPGTLKQVAENSQEIVRGRQEELRSAESSEHGARRAADAASQNAQLKKRASQDATAAAQAAMTELPVQQREVIVLRIWGGMTLQEVADVVDRPVSTVFSRYRAGLAAIRKEMENSHGQQ